MKTKQTFKHLLLDFIEATATCLVSIKILSVYIRSSIAHRL